MFSTTETTEVSPFIGNHLVRAKDLFYDDLVLEIQRLDKGELPFALDYIKSCIGQLKMHTVFDRDMMAKLVSGVHMDDTRVVRDFILSLTDRYLITLAGDNYLDLTSLAEIISNFSPSIAREFDLLPTTYPEQIVEGMRPDREAVVSTLVTNPFLVVIVMIYLLGMSVYKEIESETAIPQAGGD